MLKSTDKRPPVSVTVKLHPDLVSDLAAYSRAIEEKPDFVVGEALRQLFDDKDFKALRTSKPELWKPADGGKKSKTKSTTA